MNRRRHVASARDVERLPIRIDDRGSVPCLGEFADVITGQQRHVASLQQREVGDHELDRTITCENDQ